MQGLPAFIYLKIALWNVICFQIFRWRMTFSCPIHRTALFRNHAGDVRIFCEAMFLGQAWKQAVALHKEGVNVGGSGARKTSRFSFQESGRSHG